MPNRELQGSQQGRWLSPDPAGSGWNQYAYVENNPLSYIDPLGLFLVTCWVVRGGDLVCIDFAGDGLAGVGFDPLTTITIDGTRGFDGGFSFSGNFGADLCNSDFIPCGALPTNPGQAIGNTIGLLGLPSPCQTEFGAPCTPQVGNSFAPAAPAAGVFGTLVCEILEPCGIVEDAALLGLLGWESWQLYKFSKGRKQNIVPSWAEGAQPRPGESASQFANRLCAQQYPPDGAGCGTGPGSERSKIQKWARDKFGI